MWMKNILLAILGLSAGITAAGGLFSFIIGAFISPTPDVFSQTMIAVPILILYEISIIIVKYLLQK